MANRRTIQSPGVEIREIDLSTRANVANGTSVFVAGFAPQGPTYEILNVASVADFENIYGTPTNAAERYFYYSVKQVFNAGSNAIVNVARLPYGASTGVGFSSKYSALAFPVVALTASNDSLVTSSTQTHKLSAAVEYWFGSPTLVELTDEDYQSIIQGGVTWNNSTGGSNSNFTSTTLGNAGFIVLNEAKTTINENFEGLYFNITDNLQPNPSTPFDAALSIKTITSQGTAQYGNNFATVPTTRVGFAVSATNDNIASISRDIENIPTFSIAASGTGTTYNDTAIISLFKVRVSPFNNTATTLTYVLQEGYTASFYSNRKIQSQVGGATQSFYAETIVNDTSPSLKLLINPNIANSITLDNNGNPTKSIRVLTSDAGNFKAANYLYPLGVYAQTLDTTTNKVIGDVAGKLSSVLNLADNPDILPIDITIDAGLSTIAAAVAVSPLSTNGIYDDTVYSAALSSQVDALSNSTGGFASNALTDAWNSVQTQFVQLATSRRKDHVFISDPLRHALVQGANFKVLDDKSKNFSSNVYWPLRNLYSLVGSNSYTATYANWARATDVFSSKSVWLPFSGFAAAAFASSDQASYPWSAPAGLNRGVITGISDIAINPQQKQRDLLYKVSLNPVVNFPGEGFVIMGQKTLLAAPSAFDRLNVRRLFLFLEKSVLNTTKYFVFEPNTSFTRNRLVNTISPVFDLAKNTQGLYDYLIVCNDTNNTADTIDDNTLVVDIYIKPVRTAEFILVNFYATKTSQNFQELIQ